MSVPPAGLSAPAIGLTRRGLRLAWFTIGYNVVEGLVAVAAGVLAGLVSLVGFGIDSGIESMSAVLVAMRLGYGSLAPVLGVGFDMDYLTKLAPYFLAGGVLQCFKRRIGMHGRLALVSAGAFVGLVLVSPSWGGQLGSLFAAYVLLYLGHVLPSPEWVRVHDVSYGMYIYGFPVQQLIMTFLPGVGFWGLTFLALALTAPLAAASWFLLESPIINRARASLAVEHASPVPAVPRKGEAPTGG